MAGAAGGGEVGDVLAAEMGNLMRIAGEVLDDAVQVRLDGVDIEGERAAVAVAAMHGAVGRGGPIGVDGGHLVARGAGLLGVSKMEIRETADGARGEDDGAIETDAGEEAWPTRRGHENFPVFAPALM
jgi:hypothetical protein